MQKTSHARVPTQYLSDEGKRLLFLEAAGPQLHDGGSRRRVVDRPTAAPSSPEQGVGTWGSKNTEGTPVSPGVVTRFPWSHSGWCPQPSRRSDLLLLPTLQASLLASLFPPLIQHCQSLRATIGICLKSQESLSLSQAKLPPQIPAGFPTPCLYCPSQPPVHRAIKQYVLSCCKAFARVKRAVTSSHPTGESSGITLLFCPQNICLCVYYILAFLQMGCSFQGQLVTCSGAMLARSGIWD